MSLFGAQVWSRLSWKSQLCSVYTAWTIYHASIVLIFFSALSKLRSCQPTKELQAIKCRRMRIITSLLYSVESLTPRSCLPSSLSAPQLGRVWGNDLLCSPRQELQSWHAKNVWTTRWAGTDATPRHAYLPVSKYWCEWACRSREWMKHWRKDTTTTALSFYPYRIQCLFSVSIRL